MSRYIDADALGIGKADRNAFTVPEYRTVGTVLLRL